MSTFSLDSLDQCTKIDKKSMKKPEVVKALRLTCKNCRNGQGEIKNSRQDDNPQKDEEFNESSFVERTSISKNIPIAVKFNGNAIIASGNDVNGKFCSRIVENENTEKLAPGTYFRTGRSVEKKFNVPRRSSLSSTSTSSSEFRRGGSFRRTDGDDDVDDENEALDFMKPDKKPGNVKPAILDNSKRKTVSYLELHRKKFGVNGHRCIRTSVDSSLSICDDSLDKQRPVSDSDRSIPFPRDEKRRGGFPCRHPEASEELESRESFSSLALGDVFTKNDFSSLHDGKINSRIRVTYEPYSIEDYKSLSVPRADRSLGPDRREMETKGEWLMRRRTYGDSVSSLNRQRIQRRAEKLMADRAPEEKKRNPAKRSSRLSENGKPSSIDRKNEKPQNRPRCKITVRKASNLDDNICETFSDNLDDESMNLKNLRQRHIDEKRTIDRLLK